MYKQNQTIIFRERKKNTSKTTMTMKVIIGTQCIITYRFMSTLFNDSIQLAGVFVIPKPLILFSIIFVFLSCRLADRVRSEKIASDFFIDASHELSLLAWNKGKGLQLTEAPYFCLHRKPSRKTDSSSTRVTRRNDKSSKNNDENNGDGQGYAGCAIYSRSHDDSIIQFHLYSGDTSTGTMKPSFVSVVKLFRMTC